MNARQMRFCEEYVKDLNGQQAAIRAGFTEKSAGNQAHRMMKNDEVRARVDFLLDKKTKECEITADFILMGIKKIAENKESSDMPRLKAYELLGRHLKLFTDIVKVEGLEKQSDEQLLKRYAELESKK